MQKIESGESPALLRRVERLRKRMERRESR